MTSVLFRNYLADSLLHREKYICNLSHKFGPRSGHFTCCVCDVEECIFLNGHFVTARQPALGVVEDGIKILGASDLGSCGVLPDPELQLHGTLGSERNDSKCNTLESCATGKKHNFSFKWECNKKEKKMSSF